ncbi:tocopherol cyclase family protein [Pseudanabaena sp. PCC 6802]|uniref:tocopherol cyclase family protein n=1 Tax=Pseudanabaena sp. PCC 6802 TaxID=118173 RepID=UPI0003490C9E|nr:tocopherol cyclase family protein [Pseudanabaena sp. PCC 6802]
MLPHSGYHWRGGSDRFFEGWYYRLTLPRIGQSFAFMYAIDDPQGGTACSGGSLQVLGIDDLHLWRTIPNPRTFHASRDRLMLEHWGAAGQGYSASDRHNKGAISDPVTSMSCRWDYHIEPIYTWGNVRDNAGQAIPTMGYLSYLPVFEPGWQILMAHGLATGAIAWNDRVYEFDRAPAYCEKNWGRSFPQQWFWLQCNAFSEYPDLTITVAGGIREFLGAARSVAMVGIHYNGKLYSFMPENSDIYCRIAPWGDWQIEAHKQEYGSPQDVCIHGTTLHRGTLIMVPRATGLEYCCRDTTRGDLKLKLNADLQINTSSNLAALEVGGKLWDRVWQFRSDRI